MDSIYRNLDRIFAFEHYGQYRKPNVLLLIGGKSYRYDPSAFLPVFPNLRPQRVVVVPGAGHWVHADKPRECIHAIGDFLLDIDLDTSPTSTDSHNHGRTTPPLFHPVPC